MTHQEITNKLNEILNKIGTTESVWAMTLLKSAQSKNIDISEWNTFVLKMAEVAGSTDLLTQAAELLIGEARLQLENGDAEGAIQTIGSAAKAAYAAALGQRTIVNAIGGAAFGHYNLTEDGLLVVGNGTEQDRKDAFVVHEDGRVSAGSNSMNPEDLVRHEQLRSALTRVDNLETYTKATRDITTALRADLETFEDETDDTLGTHWNTINEHYQRLQDAETEISDIWERFKNASGELIKIVQSMGSSEVDVMSQKAVTRELDKKLNINNNEADTPRVYGTLEDGTQASIPVHPTNIPGVVCRDTDGQTCVGPPKSGESAVNSYLLKRHLGRHSVLYPSKDDETENIEVVNKLKFVMPNNDSYFAKVGDHSANDGGGNPKVEFDPMFAVNIPSTVPHAQYFKPDQPGYVPVDLPVNSISMRAFRQNRSVRSLVIQEGVTRIEAEAFDGCKKLTSIVLADTVKMIDNNAFNNVGTEFSGAKITIRLPKALEWICQQAFHKVNVHGSITFPNRCLYIGGKPETLTAGSGKVFTSPNITQIVFEGTPKFIHKDAFLGCTCDMYVPWSKDEVAGAPWGTKGTVHYNVAVQTLTATDKNKLDGIADGANLYVHPTHTKATSGLYKITVDDEGHVSATTEVKKSDITGLGIASQKDVDDVEDALGRLTDGSQTVAHATRADRDGNGINIANNYLTKAFNEIIISRMRNAFKYTDSHNSIVPGLYLPRISMYLGEDRIDAYLPPILYTRDRLPVMSEATVLGEPLRITVDGDGKVRYEYASDGMNATVSTVALISLDTFPTG